MRFPFTRAGSANRHTASPLALFATATAIGTSTLLLGTMAGAVPGPDSVVVVANADVPDSVTLAQRYATARNIPAAQICTISVLDQDAITLDQYRTMVLAPLEACMARGSFADRIDTALLVRGIPLRVMIPDGTAMQSVSLAAALSVWHSQTTTGAMPLLGQPPGMTASCGGTPCYAARWRNPYRAGAFDPAWTSTAQGIEWHPLLVTMLDARSYDDSARLITSAIAAEHMGGARGRFLFMNGADPARGALDTQYDLTIADLQAAGFTDVQRVPFDSNTSGLQLAAFFTGSASLGTTIEGNTFLPGSLVDNLTSYGADPVNFHATGENQVSIARFVAAGASGAHGTVDEPLNNVFPSRALIVDYVHGYTLAESYLRNLPYVYWRNLVLGDPMLAPYASRPVVTIEGVSEGATQAGAIALVARATEPAGHAIASITLMVDGAVIAHADGDRVETCYVPAAAGAHAILAVAQLADDGSGDAPRTKGWTAIAYTSTSGSSVCAPPGPDGGDVAPDGAIRTDGGLDGGTIGAGAGCGCHTTRSGSRGALALVAMALASAAVSRRRRTALPPGAFDPPS